MIDCEAGVPPDSPMPTPMRASASVVTLCAMPQKTVIALQNASAAATMLRRVLGWARRGGGVAGRGKKSTKAQPPRRPPAGGPRGKFFFSRLGRTVEEVGGGRE